MYRRCVNNLLTHVASSRCVSLSLNSSSQVAMRTLCPDTTEQLPLRSPNGRQHLFPSSRGNFCDPKQLEGPRSTPRGNGQTTTLCLTKTVFSNERRRGQSRISHQKHSPTQARMVKIALNLVRMRHLAIHTLSAPQSEKRTCKGACSSACQDRPPPEPPRRLHSAFHHNGLRGPEAAGVSHDSPRTPNVHI